MTDERRRVLLCILGDKPELVTQAVSALAQLEPPWIPDAIRAIATETDSLRARKQLFKDQHFFHLLKAIGVDYIDFSPDKITALNLSDASIDEPFLATDKEKTADAIFSAVLELTASGKDHVHTVLASPRHTMSVYAASAMAILGRPGDCLSQITLPDGHKDDALGGAQQSADRTRLLHHIPILRLSSLVALRAIFNNDIAFSTLRRVLDEDPSLSIYGRDSALYIKLSNAIEISCDARHSLTKRRMQPRSAALYVLYARRRLTGRGPISDDELLAEPDEYLSIYKQLLFGEAESTVVAKEDRQLSSSGLCTARTRINAALRRVLPQGHVLSAYRVHRDKKTRGYGLTLAPAQITVAALN